MDSPLWDPSLIDTAWCGVVTTLSIASLTGLQAAVCAAATRLTPNTPNMPPTSTAGPSRVIENRPSPLLVHYEAVAFARHADGRRLAQRHRHERQREPLVAR